MKSPRLPWRTLDDPLGLELTSFRLDEQPVTLEGNGVIPIHEQDIDWKWLEFECLVSLPAGISETGHDAAATRMTVTMTSTRTNTRAAWETLGSGESRAATIRIHRDDVAQRLEFTVVATTTVDGVDHREIGRSRRFQIDVDPPDAPETGGPNPFDVVWVDFALADIGPIILRDVPDEAFWVDLTGARPTVYLNESIKHMQAILDNPRPRGRSRDLQNTLGSWIATAVWTALAGQAAGEVFVGEDGEPLHELDPLSERVLRSLVDRMEDVGSYEELLEQIVDASEDAERRRYLDDRLRVAAHRICELPSGFAAAIENAWRD